MNDAWQVAEGTGWIEMPGFGRIGPQRDNVGGGRQYFTAYVSNGEYAEALGSGITGGPESFYFEFDEPFLLSDSTRQQCVEVTISLLAGGRYAVKYHPGVWPSGGSAW